MSKEYRYQAQIIDNETDEIVSSILGFSQEDFEEEMGKRKWSDAVEKYEEQLKKEEELTEE